MSYSIRVNSSNIKLPTDKLEAINRSLSFSLDRFLDKIRTVDLNLIDINGPKGGLDKQCCVKVRLVPSGYLVTRHVASSWTEAASGALEKLRDVLSRRVQKRRLLSRRRASTRNNDSFVSIPSEDAVGRQN